MKHYQVETHDESFQSKSIIDTQQNARSFPLLFALTQPLSIPLSHALPIIGANITQGVNSVSQLSLHVSVVNHDVSSISDPEKCHQSDENYDGQDFI
jgi:hypothetical protein